MATVTPPVITRSDEQQSDRRIRTADFRVQSLPAPEVSVVRPSAPRTYPGVPSSPSAEVAPEGLGLDAALIAIDEQGNTTAALPVLFRQRIVGNESVKVFGADTSGALRVSALLSRAPGNMQLNLRYERGSGATPRQLLPAFRLLRALRPPARMSLIINGHPVGNPDGLSNDQDFPKDLLDVTRSLAFIQSVTGSEFPMPDELDQNDIRELKEAERLLMGETVTGGWRDAKLTGSDTDWLEEVEDADQLRIEFVDHKVAQIAGHTVCLGEANFVFRTAIIDRTTRDDVHLRPGTDDRFEVSLLTAPEIGINLQDVRPPVKASAHAIEAARARKVFPDASGASTPESLWTQ